MFGFIDEIENKLSGGNNYKYKAFNFGGEGFYFSGFKTIAKCSEEEIVLKLDNSKFVILGKHLKIRDLSNGTVYITGTIFESKAVCE